MLQSLILALLIAPQAAGAPSTAPQSGGPAPGSREAMWPAPTAEDWAKPCLITWERTWEDALAVAEETRKPILICVNMDGEIASEHYAGVRYRQPDIAALYEPYVCVIASVYRHTPRDYDEQGHRVPCPRFGTVTCSEHIAIEPGLFDKYFEGQRVAPRHIGIELDREETYDVYYAFDTDSVFRKIEKTIAERDIETIEPPRDDMPLLDRVGSAAVEDRMAVERAYAEGDNATRRAIVQRVIANGGNAPMDVLRLAVFDLDVELNRLAREALAASSSESAIDLILEALKVPVDANERADLVAALDRIGQSSPRARTLATVFRGLESRSEAVDSDGWADALAESQPVDYVQERYAIESELARSAREARTRSDDAATRLELAEASLALAVDPSTAVSLAADHKTTSKYARLMFEDVQTHARRAEELGASGWRLDAALGLSAYYLGNLEEAHARAERSVAALPSGETSWNAMAVIAIFAEARKQAILKAVNAKEPWPSEWLTDVNAAYGILARHPHGTDMQVVAHYEFLWRLGASAQAKGVLDAGVMRFPASVALHDRLRGRILKEEGLAALETTYDSLLQRHAESAELEWFAGYASLVAAEFYRRASQPAEAISAYERASSRYARCIELDPATAENSAHYQAMSLAGRARIALEAGQLAESASLLTACFDARPNSAATLDGLGLSAVATTQMLIARLDALERTEEANRMQAELDALDPRMLEPAEFDRPARDARNWIPSRLRRGRGR